MYNCLLQKSQLDRARTGIQWHYLERHLLMLLSYFALLLIDYRRLREVLYKRPFIAIPMHLFTSPYSLTIENALRLCNWNLNRAKSIAQVLSVFTSHIHSPYVILYSKLQQQPFILHVSALEHASNKQITYEYHTCYCSTKARAPPLSMNSSSILIINITAAYILDSK
jgi:hypothetical protein